MTRVREETAEPRHPAGLAGRARGDRRGDHLGRPGAGGDLRGARHDAAGVPRRDGHGGRARRPARHADRALGAGHRAQPRPRRARSGGRASSTAATRPPSCPSPSRRTPWPTEAGQRSTRAPAPPVALPWAAWGSRGPASASCSGCGSSRGGGCASAAVGSPTRSSSGSRLPDCWNIRPDEKHVGGWSYEYEFAPADPAPVTTIGWRLVHITAGNLRSTGTTPSATPR